MSRITDRLHSLFDRFDMLSQTDPAQAAEEAITALSLAHRVGNPTLLASASLNLAGIEAQLGRFDSAYRYLQEADRIFSDIGDHVGIARTRYTRSLLLRDEGMYVESLRLLLDADELLRCHGRESQRGMVLNAMGIIYGRLNEPGVALERLSAALEIFTSEQDRHWQGVVHQNIGRLHAATGNLDKGYSHFLRGRELEEELDVPHSKSVADSNIGLILLRRRDFEGAKQHHELALENARRIDNSPLITFCLMNIGATYAAEGDHEKACDFFRQGLDACSSADRQMYRPCLLYNIGFSLRKLDKGEQAFPYLLSALEILEDSTNADSGNVDGLLACVHHEISCSYEERGEVESALRHARLHEQTGNRTSAQTAALALARADMRLEAERIERETQEVRRANDDLRREIDIRERELVTLAIHLAQKSTLIARLKETMASADLATADELKRHLHLLNDELGREEGTEQIWKRFEQQFRQIHPEFVGRICRQFPDLSPAEIRLCALLRLDISTKEIAAILSLSTRSIEIYRSRIRGKLGLESGQSLVRFLCSFS